MRRPGIRNERGTHVGARRNRPSFASSASRTSDAPAEAGGGFFVFFVLLAGAVFDAMSAGLPGKRRRRLRERPLRRWMPRASRFRGVLVARRGESGKEKARKFLAGIAFVPGQSPPALPRAAEGR